MKKTLCIMLMLVIILPLLSGCTEKNVAEDGVKTIVIGHHYRPEDDPYWVDEITGEYGMNEENRRAAIEALNVVKEKLGVEITWVWYPSDIKQCLLQSVLAGDPICHLAIMANGTQAAVLSQNVLQPLDKYVDIFKNNPDYEWLLLDKCFGKYYLLNREYLFINNWPLVYNATLIEQIPALKKNGKTVYPATLYEEGKWTWSVFREYLKTIEAYYRGKEAHNGSPIYPFNTNYGHALIFALHSNGACLYNGYELGFNTPDGIDAAEYLESLIDEGLLNCLYANNRSTNAGYTNATEAFLRGETVFTNAARWRTDNCASEMAKRGESMGLIPFPRPDDIEMDDPYEDYGKSRYQLYSAVADSVGLLRGIDEEESRLALEAFAMYRNEFYKALSDTENLDGYKKNTAASKAVEEGYDIFHSEIGDATLRIYNQLANIPENEFGESMDLMGRYCNDIFGKSVFGVNGAPSYRIHLEANKGRVFDRLESIGEALRAEGAIDLTPPSSYIIGGKALVFPKGTDEESINWLEYFGASDNVDGTYEIKAESEGYVLRGDNDIKVAKERAKEEGLDKPEEVPFEKGRFSIDASLVVFDEDGEYAEAVVVKIVDSSGNVNEKKYTCHIYDEENLIPPTLELNEAAKAVGRDVDTSKVKWSDFVSVAKDVNGIDLKSRVSADVTKLDVTVPGVYPVTVYVTDFAGNRTEIETFFEVKK